MKKKTIFTSITLGLIGLLGFGFLGGIDYQPKQAKASEITTQPTKKYALVNNITPDELYDSDKIYYIVAKNYETNGEGVFYQDTINLANSRTTESNMPYTNAYADFTMIRDNTFVVNRMQFASTQTAGVYHISYISIYNTQTQQQLGLYQSNATGGFFNRENCAFLGTNFKRYTGLGQAFYNSFVNAYLKVFFDIYVLQDTFYEFSDINPYTYWNVAKNSPYVNFVTWNGSTGGLSHKDIKLSPFYVGGLAFDYIKLYYIGINAGDHFNINGEQYIYQGNSNTYMTFSHAVFYNSATQYEVKFYQQEVTYGAFGYEGLTYLGSFNYTNLNFKILQFFEDLNPVMINDLDALSNINQNIGYHSTQDVGLGNAFALISQAFTAWIPILSISVIPGITLGMLLFLPLIAGIIVLIIWIVKR